MTTLRLPLVARPAGFAAIAALVYAAAFFVLSALPGSSNPTLLASALTVDLVVLVPLAYYVLLVRGQGWPVATIAPVILASLYGAHVLIPDAHDELLTVLLPAIALFELAVTGVVLYSVGRGVQSLRGMKGAGTVDFLDELKRGFRAKIDVRVAADIVASEIGMLYYAFGTWRKTPPTPGNGVFPYHKTSSYGAILAGILIAATVEIIGGHFLLMMWSPVAAWIHLGLAVYGVIWLVGDYRAMRYRPTRVQDGQIAIRCGLRWEVDLPREQVHSVSAPTRGIENRDDYLALSASMKPDLILELGIPETVDGHYGITRKARYLGVSVDDPAAFRDAVLGIRGS